MYTKTKREALLRRLMEGQELNDELEETVNGLIKDYDEKDSFLSKMGTIQDGDGDFDFDYQDPVIVDDPTYQKELEKAKNDYADLKKKYLDRFFGGDPEKMGLDNKKEEEEEEEEKDNQYNITFDDMFKKKED